MMTESQAALVDRPAPVLMEEEDVSVEEILQALDEERESYYHEQYEQA
jgi:hypothetical protein